MAAGGHLTGDRLGADPLAASRAEAVALAAQVHAAVAVILWVLALLLIRARAAAGLLAAGTVAFSGGLYAYGLAGAKAGVYGTAPGLAALGLGAVLLIWAKRPGSAP
ncbi:MAG: DUF423 domain-containing protein [Shimia sp.]